MNVLRADISLATTHPSGVLKSSHRRSLSLWPNPSSEYFSTSGLRHLSDCAHSQYPTATPYLRDCGGWLKYNNHLHPVKQFGRASKGQTKDPKDWVMDCLKNPGTGHREGKERKMITLRAVKFNPGYRSEGVEEYGVP